MLGVSYSHFQGIYSILDTRYPKLRGVRYSLNSFTLLSSTKSLNPIRPVIIHSHDWNYYRAIWTMHNQNQGNGRTCASCNNASKSSCQVSPICVPSPLPCCLSTDNLKHEEGQCGFKKTKHWTTGGWSSKQNQDRTMASHCQQVKQRAEMLNVSGIRICQSTETPIRKENSLSSMPMSSSHNEDKLKLLH